MFSWAHKRQLVYGLAVLAFIVVVIGVPVYLTFFNKAPTCIDEKQNGNETGIDCGGSCNKACSSDVLPEPILLWSRAFPVSQGINNLVAYVQNPNVNHVSEPVEYLFRVYDKDNVLLGTRIGRVAVPPSKNFPIFEASFDAGERKISKVFFEFTEPVVWKNFAVAKPEFEVVDQQIIGTSTIPNIKATIRNKTLNNYQNVATVVVLYNEEGNSSAASRTVIDEFPAEGDVKIVFTWPKPFDFDISKVEIIPILPI